MACVRARKSRFGLQVPWAERIQALRALLENAVAEGRDSSLQQSVLAFAAEQVAEYVSTSRGSGTPSDEAVTGALSELMQSAMACSQV